MLLFPPISCSYHLCNRSLIVRTPFFCRATQTAAKKGAEETVPPPIKMQDVKAARQLASDITQSGAKLYDLLENEYTERTERARALRFLDLAASTSGKT